MLGWSVGTVRSQMHKAMTKLRVLAPELAIHAAASGEM